MREHVLMLAFEFCHRSTYIEGWLPIEGLSETPVGEELGSVTRDNWVKLLPV